MRFCRFVSVWLLAACSAWAQWGGELRLCIRSEPRSFHPALVDNDSAETFRYLTGGVLVRVNRATQKLEPELATSWTVENAGRTIVFRLRPGVRFSDGAPLTADDVAHTMQTLMDPALKSPTGDSFRSGPEPVKTVVRDKLTAAVVFPKAVADAARLFDQVAIHSRHSPLKEAAALGPFHLKEHRRGAYILLARNPHYWKTEGPRRLPYLDSVRLEIQQNREIEMVRFERGEIHVLAGMDAQQFERISRGGKAWFRDAGATLESEMLWFNLKPSSPLPEHKKRWFRSRNFRRAVSHAIRRQDLCSVVYRGHACPGAAPFSPANRFWFNAALRPHAFDLAAARQMLAADGLAQREGALRDKAGNAVEFSVITNSGNRARERMAAMLQQDLAALGIKLNVVTLDFPALLQRIAKTFDYEACLLGLINVDLDPNGQMNIWLSSSSNHPWNPNQPSPETAWEAEIDNWMREQASALDPKRRKEAFDRVQRIVWEEAPVLYLVHPNALVAASSALRNLEPSVLRPQLLWNVDKLYFARRP